ncbi:MAG: hypothetical protein R3D62_02855 [Xanthobacteraceae bacterium]
MRYSSTRDAIRSSRTSAAPSAPFAEASGRYSPSRSRERQPASIAARSDGAAGGGRYRAQWNDDYHHMWHVLLTGETFCSYYREPAEAPRQQIVRALGSGRFVYQGRPSKHRGGAAARQPSGHLPPTAFVSSCRDHDQVGNRARGSG